MFPRRSGAFIITLNSEMHFQFILSSFFQISFNSPEFRSLQLFKILSWLTWMIPRWQNQVLHTRFAKVPCFLQNKEKIEWNKPGGFKLGMYGPKMWKRRVSIPVPRACEARALPIELRSRFFDSGQKMYYIYTISLGASLGWGWVYLKRQRFRSALYLWLYGRWFNSHARQGDTATVVSFLAATSDKCWVWLGRQSGSQLLKFSSAMVSVPSTFESHLSEK